MSTRTNLFRYCAYALVLFALSACGGGGGGGGDGGPGFTVNPRNLTFTAASTSSATPPNQTVTLNVTGQVFVAAFFGGAAISNVTFVDTGPATRVYTVVPRTPASLGIGTHTGTLRIIVCADANCNSPLSGSPTDVGITYQIGGLTLSPSSVNLTAVEGVASAPVGVNVSNVNGSAAWTTSISYAGNPAGWLTVPASGATLPATLNFAGAPLPAGTYSATVTISTASHSLPIPVTYTVRPNLSVAPSSVTFTAVTGQASPPAAQSVAVSTAAGATSYSISTVYGAGDPTWLNVSGGLAPGNLSIAPNRTDLSPGTHTATITLTPSAGASINVSVTYTLTASSLTVSPASHTFNIDAASTATDAFLKRTVTTGDTGAALTWTASSNVPWLTVTNNSGSSGDTATLTLIPAQIDLLDAGASTATVTFSYSGPGGVSGTKTVGVTLNLSVARVNYVAPYVSYVNEQKDVIIRGSGFTQASLPVLFDGQAAQSATRVSDTEIRAVPPNFASAGRYKVKTSNTNSMGLERSAAELVVREKPNYGYFALTTNAGIQGMHTIYDAERDAVISARAYFTIDPARPASKVTRFSYDSGTASWSRVTADFVGLLDIALSPDGKELIVLCQDFLHRVDPQSLAILTSTALPATVGGTVSQLAVTNDGKVIIRSLRKIYSLRSKNFTPLVIPTETVGIDASPDGSRAVMGEATNSGDVPFSYYDASTGTMHVTALRRYYSGARFDRLAKKMLSDFELFDSNFQLLGALRPGEFVVGLTPDGDRAYTLSFTGSTQLTVYAYDVSVAMPTFPTPSPIVPTDYPGVARGILSLDGRTAFLVGDEKFVVLPLP